MALDHVKVSICCVVYNQARYIKEMLDGILMQKTTFKYQIIIHDDVSTDGTVEILKTYKEKYPDKIELILEEENQFSKGAKILKDIIYPYVKGKYIAFCEGDDFWIYDGKLQAQYDFMESHPEVSLCYHNALVYEEDTDKLSLNVINQSSGYIGERDIICTSKGWYPTASVFYRVEYLAEQPDLSAPTGDEGIRCYMACRGKLYFINRAWSVYRQFSKGSWNSKFEADKGIAQTYIRNLVNYFINFNEYSHGRFERYFYERLSRSLMYYIQVHDAKQYTIEEFRGYMEELKTITEHKADALIDRIYVAEVIRCTDYYPVTIEQKVQCLVTENTQLYIYGAGMEALKALTLLQKNKIDVEGLVVSGKTKRSIGQEFFGYPVYEIDVIPREKSVVIWPCLIREREKDRGMVIQLLLEENDMKVIV